MDDLSPKTELSIAALRVNTVPAVISGNFAELNTWLDNLLADQVTLVTPETLADEKKVIANLRKLAKEIDSRTKEVVAVVSTDVVNFQGNMKALKAKVNEVVDAKDEQIKALENETKQKCAQLLHNELLNLWDDYGLEEEFRTAPYLDLALLGSMTAKGALTKAAQTELENRCKLDKAQQDKIKARLNELELRCLKADINPPLTRATVEPFLFADDAAYYARLDALLNAEIDRKAEAERRLRAKLEAENQRKIDAALAQQKAEITQEQLKAAATAVENTATAAKNAVVQPDAPTPIPEDSAYYSLIVTYKAIKTITFASRPGVPHDKIKARFMSDAKLLEGVDPADVMTVEVVEK